LLYTIKRGFESISLSIATSPQNKTNLLANFANRRLAEAIHLSKLNNSAIKSEQLASTLAEATKEIEQAHEIAEQSSDETTEKNLLTAVKTSGQHQLKQINLLAGTINITDNTVVAIDSLANAIENLRDQDNDMNEEINDHDADNDEIADQKSSTTPQNFIAREKTKNLPENNTPQIAKQNLKQAESQVKLIKSNVATTTNQEQKNKSDQLVKHLNKKIDQAKSLIKQEDWQGAIEQANTAVAISRNINVFLNNQKTATAQEPYKIIEQPKDKNENYNSDIILSSFINNTSTTSDIEPKTPQKTEQPKTIETSAISNNLDKTIQEKSKNIPTGGDKKSEAHSKAKER
jgi:hypothetical protein